MLLIADSGSTKADWILIDNHQLVAEYKTDGLNPVLLSEKNILEKISAEKHLQKVAPSINELHFFGAGCGNEEGRQRMADALTSFFPSAKIFIENDLLAAAIATCGNEKGMVCILGTGSNCCYYDGNNIHRKNFGLGYILGDEGSGAYYGKLFLRAYLYEQLPEEISEHFFNEYHLTFQTIIEAVYKKPDANLFLSSFMPFIIKHKNSTWIKNFLENGIEEFFKTNVLNSEWSIVNSQWQLLPIHFVGSVAYELKDFIVETGKKKNLPVGKIIKQPKDELVKFFL